MPESNAFSLQAPAEWEVIEVPGGVRFENKEDGTAIIAYFQPIPITTDPAEYLSSAISETLTFVESNSPEDFEILKDGTGEDGHHQIELVGKLEPTGVVSKLQAEMWTDDGALFGISLEGPIKNWGNVEPLWPLLRQGYTPNPVETTLLGLAETYVHPSGLFTMTIPVGWGIAEEMDGGVLLGDTGGYAQLSITATEFNRRPKPAELSAAMEAMLGDLPQQETYEELAREEASSDERLVEFEALSPDEGFYRTELRVFPAGSIMAATSFNAPPQDWDLFAPDYQAMIDSLQFQEPALDDAMLDSDPVVGIDVGEVMLYRASGGSLWVSAPIYNRRPRNIGDMTFAVELYDAEDKLLAAESYRMEQRILPAGGVHYFSQRIPPKLANLDNVAYADVKIADAKDIEREPFQAWGYAGGAAELDDEGNVTLKINLRNAGGDVRRSVYVVALLYDADGKLVFARGETMRLPYATPPGAEVDVKLTAWGPLPELASFDVIGEVPR
ncbi:MAG: hypothetical protein J5I90_02655 [Caldilineales bacterium]|nr:hypothetical protein [Caldilineales bacterium]